MSLFLLYVTLAYAAPGKTAVGDNPGRRTPHPGGQNNVPNIFSTPVLEQLAAPIPLICPGDTPTAPTSHTCRDATVPDTQTSTEHAPPTQTAPMVTFHVQGALHALTAICWIHFSGEGRTLSEQDFHSALRNTARQIPAYTVLSTIHAVLTQRGGTDRAEALAQFMEHIATILQSDQLPENATRRDELTECSSCWAALHLCFYPLWLQDLAKSLSAEESDTGLYDGVAHMDVAVRETHSIDMKGRFFRQQKPKPLLRACMTISLLWHRALSSPHAHPPAFLESCVVSEPYMGAGRYSPWNRPGSADTATLLAVCNESQTEFMYAHSCKRFLHRRQPRTATDTKCRKSMLIGYSHWHLHGSLLYPDVAGTTPPRLTPATNTTAGPLRAADIHASILSQTCALLLSNHPFAQSAPACTATQYNPFRSSGSKERYCVLCHLGHSWLQGNPPPWQRRTKAAPRGRMSQSMRRTMTPTAPCGRSWRHLPRGDLGHGLGPLWRNDLPQQRPAAVLPRQAEWEALPTTPAWEQRPKPRRLARRRQRVGRQCCQRQWGLHRACRPGLRLLHHTTHLGWAEEADRRWEQADRRHLPRPREPVGCCNRGSTPWSGTPTPTSPGCPSMPSQKAVCRIRLWCHRQLLRHRVGQAGQAMQALQLRGTDQHGPMLLTPCFPVPCQLEPRERQWAASQGLSTSVSKQVNRLQISLTTLCYTMQLHTRQCARRKISNHQSRPWWPPPYTETVIAAVPQCAPLITQAGDVRPTAPRSRTPRWIRTGTPRLLTCVPSCLPEIAILQVQTAYHRTLCRFYSSRPIPVIASRVSMGKSPAAKARSATRPPTRFRSPARTPAWEYPEPIEEWQPLPYEELRQWYQNHWNRRQNRTPWKPRTQTSYGKSSSSSSTWRRVPPQPPMPKRRGAGHYEKDLEGDVGQPVGNPDSEPKVADPQRAEPEAPGSKEVSVKVDPAPSKEMEMGEEESDLLVDKMIQLAKTTATRFGVTSEQLLDAMQMTWLPALEQKLWRTTETCLLCSHSPGNLREWQRRLLTKSHSRIANEAKMTWYHLYLVMSIHDDRMHPGLSISIAFDVSASFKKTLCVPCTLAHITIRSRRTGKSASHASSNEPSLVSQNAALLFEQLVEDLHKAQ